MKYKLFYFVIINILTLVSIKTAISQHEMIDGIPNNNIGIVHYGETKNGAKETIEKSDSLTISEISCVKWLIYSKKNSGALVAVINFDQEGKVLNIYEVKKDTVKSKKTYSTEGEIYFWLIPTFRTLKYKDSVLFTKKDYFTMLGGANIGLLNNKWYLSGAGYGCLYSHNLNDDVEYIASGSKGIMTNITFNFNIGRYINYKYGHVIPYAGYGLSIYSIPTSKDSAGIHIINGTRDVAYGSLICGVKSRLYKRINLSYQYTNTFQLSNIIKLSAYYLSIGYGFGNDNSSGILLGLSFNYNDMDSTKLINL